MNILIRGGAGFLGARLARTLLATGGLSLFAARPDVAVVYHLAAAVSGECEADFDLGMRLGL